MVLLINKWAEPAD